MKTSYSIAQDLTDIKIENDIIKIKLTDKSTKLSINGNDRNINKQYVAEVEEVVHSFIGKEITHDTLTEMHDKLSPVIDKLKSAVIGGIRLA